MAANRFKKSIESVVSNTEVDTKTNINNNTSNNTNSNILSNILNIIPKDEQRGKNITFYLSSEVEEAVSKIAKKNKISKSKLVDSILKQVLLEGKK